MRIIVVGAPNSGLLDVGRYPHGVDDLSVQLAATLEAATFGSIPRDHIMSWKYRKLLMNLGDDQRRAGGLSWQSLQRGTGTIETDHLTGEIVLLGRLHGIPTPANRALQYLAAEMARTGEPPASRRVDDVLRAIDTTIDAT